MDERDVAEARARLLDVFLFDDPDVVGSVTLMRAMDHHVHMSVDESDDIDPLDREYPPLDAVGSR